MFLELVKIRSYSLSLKIDAVVAEQSRKTFYDFSLGSFTLFTVFNLLMFIIVTPSNRIT